MKYNDEVALTVKHGKRDVWSYVTFLQGLKMTQFLNSEQVEPVLAGLRATGWQETHLQKGDIEIWKFKP